MGEEEKKNGGIGRRKALFLLWFLEEKNVFLLC